MLKKILLLTALMLYVNVAFSQVVSIGNGTETDDQLPIEPYYNYTYSQSIYLASEIGQTGNIYRIKYKGDTNLSISSSNEWVIYIGHTSQDVFTPNNWIATSAMTQVFAGTIAVVDNNVEIVLDTPFNYNGTDNLVIAVDENQASGDNSADNFLSTNVTGFRSIVYRNDNNNPDPATISENTISQSAIPNIDLDFNATACTAPTALQVTNITTSSADFSWTAGNAETEWEVEYGIKDFMRESGTTATVNASTYNATSLTAATSYEYYVRAKCNATELSAWVGPFEFTTACATVTTFPFTENFEGITTGQPNCWGIAGTTTTNSYHWNSYVTGYQGRGMRFNSFNNSSGRTSELTTPTFDLSGLATAELKFHFKNPTGGDFEVLISTNGGTSYTSLEAGLTGQTDWIEKTYNLTSYIGSDVQIQFKGTSNFGSGNAYISLDNVIVREIPSCVAPSNLTATNITDTAATLGWTAQNSETSWEVEYGVDGFTQGSGTTVNVSMNPVTVNTLTGNTAYEFYVRANCGGGDNSTWAGPFDFSTPCSAYTIPYFEGFETGYTNSQTLSGCLTQESIAGGNDWTANNTATSYNRSPRTGDWNAYLRYGNEDWFFIPINLTAGQSYTVTMYARQDGSTANNVNLTISYGTAGNAAAMTNEIVPATGLINGDYQKLTGNFTPTSTSLYYVGIKGYLNSSPWYISIDDISIDVSPNCLEPTNLTVSNITDTSATLGWTAENSETSWEVEYGTDGFMQGTGTTVNATTNPVVVNMLTGNTAYEFYVRANCGAGDNSTWAGPFDFTTICSSYTASYSQNFDGVSTPNIDECWTASIVGATSSFAGIESSTFNDLSAPNSVRINNSSDNDGEYYLVSPRFSDLDNTKRIRFQIYKDIGNDTDGDVIEIGVISDISNLNSFTNIHTFALSDFDEDAWKLMTVALSSYSGGAGHIAIKYQPGTGDFNSWYIDDFVYEVAPTVAPTCAVNLNATANEANCGNSGYTATWDAVANADGYRISIGTTAGGSDLVNNQDIGNNTSYNFGTTISTTYYWTITPYNTVGDATGCTEASFTTSANGCYCNPTSTSTATYIDSFSTTGAEENILNENSGHATDGYDDLYATTAVKVISQNSFDFNVTIQGGTLGCAIWIDWNGDYAFDPSTELVYETTTYSSGPFSGTITLPNAIPNGEYRMRVLVDYNDSTPGDESCAFNSGRGEAEDYKIIVDNPLSIQDETLRTITYYPNPVSNFLKINGSKPLTQVSVSNIMGQEVIKIHQSATEYNIDMSNLKNGMYIVRVYSDQSFKTLKIMKQ